MFLCKSRRFRATPLLLIACMGIGVIAGCGGSTSHTSTTMTPTVLPTAVKPNPYAEPQPCTSPAPDECRFWVPGVIAVAVSAAVTATIGGDLTTGVTTTISHQFGLTVSPYTGSRQVSSIVPIGTGAVVFLNDAHQDDAALLTDIDTINAAILAPDLNGLSRGYITVDQSTAWIVGASPDWYGTPSQAGGDHVHGSPDGPPDSTAPSTVALQPTLPPSANVASGPDVYVLDTGFRDPSGYPAAGASALFDNLHSVWDEENPVVSLSTDTPGVGKLIAPYEFDQEDPAMAALTPTPAYSPSNYRPVNVADHGIAVSALIHWLAPAAHIHQERVLNDYGVGDLQALLTTLQAIYANGKVRAIINLSLNYGPPTACMAQYWDAVKGGNGGGTKAALQFATTGCQTSGYTIGADSRRYLTLGLALNALTQDRGDVVVAAAGNGSDGGVHVAANMPALYCGVVATGAVTTANGSTLTDFSNRPDTPCMTFTVGHGSTDSEYRVKLSTPTTALALGQNVCSLHFQLILPYDAAPPANDLALWSGTSFAAALVSGDIAANRSIVPGSGGGAVTIANQTMPCKG